MAFNKVKKHKTLIIPIVICLIIFFAGLFLPWSFNQESSNYQESYNLGDKAAVINGLFSGLAFAGVISAIFMQRNELELQREELSVTRAELHAQREEFQIQNDTLKQQRFENTFFNMMQLQQQITDNITFSFTTDEYTNKYDSNAVLPSSLIRTVNGREAFRVAFEECPHKIRNGKYVEGMRGVIGELGLDGYATFSTSTYFDHYFRHIYRILKFVYSSPLINNHDRYEYAAMLRGQLSRYELVWLYYNGLSEFGRDIMKPYIERFAMLKNLRHELLVEGIELGYSYGSSAFIHDCRNELFSKIDVEKFN